MTPEWYQAHKNDPTYKKREADRYLRNKRNPKRRAQVAAAAKKWRINHKETPRQRLLVVAQNRRYNAKRRRAELGLSLAQYLYLLVFQDQRCAICKTPFQDIPHKRNPRALDHDHKTNKVRGILCRTCNLLLGHAKDNSLILDAATRYLKEKS